MAKNALLMIHPAWNVCIGHAQAMRECADVLDKFSESAIIATAASTGISEDDMRARYYADYKDHWLTFNDAVKDGLVTDTTEYEAAALPAAAEKMTYKQLLDHFQKSQHPDAPGLAERLKNIWEKTLATFTTHKSASPVGKQTQPNLDMNIEELKKSLADGTLTPEAVAQALTEAAQPATPSAAATDSDAALAAAQKQMADDLAAGRLVRIRHRDNDPPVTQQISICRLAERRLPARVRRVIRWFLEMHADLQPVPADFLN